MKRHAFLIGLLCASLLLSAGCLQTEPLTDREPPETADPHEHTPSAETPEDTPPSRPDPVLPPFPAPSDVYADWSVLEAFEPFRPVGTRLTEAPMTELTPGDDYGILVPFRGLDLYFTDTDYVAGSLLGLSTAEGCVVLDPVCADISPLSHTDYYGVSAETRNVYVLRKAVPAPPGSSAPDGIPVRQCCALAAMDGSWATGFDFESVMSWSGGAAGVLDARANAAVLYDDAGQPVLDTRELDWLDQLAEYQLYSLLAGGPVRLADGRLAVIRDRTPEPLAAEADYLEPFGEDGLAPAYLYSDSGQDRCGYISADTLDWAIEPVWNSGTAFCGGVAGVNREGGVCFIDTSGTVLQELGPGWIWLDPISSVFCFSREDGQTLCCGPDLQPLLLDGEPAQLFSGVLYRETEDGLHLQFPGGEPFFVPGIRYLTTVQGDLAFCQADGEARTLVVNSRGEILVDLPDFLWPRTDPITGETYFHCWDNDQRREVLMTADGQLLRTGAAATPWNGLIRVTDAVSTGLQDLAGNWILRLPMDRTD